jgi:aspartyl-tRNA(Asn)/glutamyl-tRNA(Gln) amidotransferase subunit C
MKLTREDVARVALLARLRLLPEELDQLTAELQNILQYMDKLRELDTFEIEPFTHAVDTSNAFREDVVTNTPNPDAILANAPAKAKTFFKVPKIIE